MAELLFDGSALRITGSETDRPKLFATFDHWRHTRDSFPQYAPLKFALKNGYGHISLQTRQNDWFLNKDTRDVQDFLTTFCSTKESCAIGFSMGGYGALRFANALRLRRALLLSPQYSIFPDKAPYETGYLKEAAQIDPALDQLEPMDGGVQLEGIIAYDPRLAPVDRRHADQIRTIHTGLKPAALPFGGHPALKHFDGTDVAFQIMRAFIENDLSVGAIRGVHGLIGRDSKRYKQHLKAYLAKRRRRSSSASKTKLSNF